MPAPLTIDQITDARRVTEFAIVDLAKRLWRSTKILRKSTEIDTLWDVMLDGESVGEIHQNSSWTGSTFVTVQRFEGTAREHGETAMFDDITSTAIWIIEHHIRSRPL